MCCGFMKGGLCYNGGFIFLAKSDRYEIRLFAAILFLKKGYGELLR